MYGKYLLNEKLKYISPHGQSPGQANMPDTLSSLTVLQH